MNIKILLSIFVMGTLTGASYIYGYISGKKVQMEFETNNARASEGIKIIRSIRDSFGTESGIFVKEIYKVKDGKLVVIKVNDVLTIRAQ